VLLGASYGDLISKMHHHICFQWLVLKQDLSLDIPIWWQFVELWLLFDQPIGQVLSNLVAQLASEIEDLCGNQHLDVGKLVRVALLLTRDQILKKQIYDATDLYR